MKKIRIGDIFFGKIDAKNEFSDNSPSDKETFMQSFLLPDNISIDSFKYGKKFFITGLKGTGKTALMRYISLALEQNNSHTHFFLFKDEVGEEEKSNLTKGSDWIALKTNKSDERKDYETVWEWFILRKIVEICEGKEIALFKKDAKWNAFVSCVKAAKLDKKDRLSLFPPLDHANITLKMPQGSSVELEYKGKEDESKKDQQKTKFVDYVKQIISLYKALTPGEDNLYFFIDEVELSYGEKKQYLRDIWMIRDLVITIDRINRISREKSFGLFIITGLRREVLNSTESAGKEINKSVEDFGVNLMWQQSGVKTEHPLIKIIHKRLLSAERNVLEENERCEESKIWDRYFPCNIKNSPAQEYILNKTWYRPRDIVRFLTIAQEQDANANSFKSELFEKINKDYSSKSWTEQTEELKATYTTDEIEGIKRILTGLSCPFSFIDITKKTDQARQIYTPVEQLLSKYKLSDILFHLYKIGIIGNTGDVVRFAYRGDPDLLLEKDMKIHDALWNFLTITPRPQSPAKRERE